MDTSIRTINQHTRDHRRISDTINTEKLVVKNELIHPSSATESLRPEELTPGRGRPNLVHQPSRQLEQVAQKVMQGSNQKNPFTQFLQHFSIQKNKNQTTKPIEMSPQGFCPIDEVGQDNEYHFDEDPEAKALIIDREVFLLVMALGNLAIYYSEMICYALLILNHMCNSSILSLPFPLMVFLWAMLSVPRPSKTFWICLITYTELLIVVKYIFQFNFVQSDISLGQPRGYMNELWLPRLFGVEKHENFLIYDLAQLIFIFLHRAYLKNNGLWRDHIESTRDLEKIAVNQNNSTRKE
ncbi:Piezo-type mechanosensitive ion channel component 2 [Cichlidogyrus casuarinus]|uniref:Piezo-type mechanosensitive ion channel component 2 n=1 Tax=Cichlidogyrus casuarinus TaxID=1844966 RepID=A0ABD2QNI8_9PLAT